jgi:hypothetical protein
LTKKQSFIRKFFSKYKEAIWTITSFLAILDSQTVRGVASFLVSYFGVGAGLSIATSIYALALMTFVILGGFQTASFVGRKLGISRQHFYTTILHYAKPIVIVLVVLVATVEGALLYASPPRTEITSSSYITNSGNVSGTVSPFRFGEQITAIQFTSVTNSYLDYTKNGEFSVQIPLNTSYQITVYFTSLFGFYHGACTYPYLVLPQNVSSIADLTLEC